MGGHSTTATTTQSTENVTESNLQDTGGVTVAGNGGNTSITSNSFTTTSDEGAINAGAGVASKALEINGDVSQAAIDLGNSAVSTGAAVANHGLDNAAAAYQSGLTFGTSALDAVESIAQESAQSNANLVNNALGGFQSLATQNSASSGTQLQKVALYAIIAAVVIAYFVSRR